MAGLLGGGISGLLGNPKLKDALIASFAAGGNPAMTAGLVTRKQENEAEAERARQMEEYRQLQMAEARRQAEEAQKRQAQEIIARTTLQHFSENPNAIAFGGPQGNQQTQLAGLLSRGVDPSAAGGLISAGAGPKRTNIENMLLAAGVPEGSPQWQQKIMEYAFKPRSSVTVNNGLVKPPAGYRFDPNDPTAVIPLTGGPADPAISKEGREGAGNISRIDTSLNNYRSALETYGTQIVPNAEKKVLAASHKDLLLEMKELYKLGVLNGPDYEIMLDVIEDPTAVWTAAQGYDRKDLLKQLDAVVVPKLAAAKKLYEQQYGRQFNSPGPMGSAGAAVDKPLSEMTTEELTAALRAAEGR